MFLFPVPLIGMGAGVVTDPDVEAWVAAVVINGGSVSAPRKALVYDLVTALKSDGVWTALDRLWLLAAENEASALTDLVVAALATAVNSPTFTADSGYSGFGNTTYVNSNLNPFSAGGNYTQNSATIASWINAAASGSFPNPIGADEVSNKFSNIEFSSGYYVRINDATILSDSTSFSTGLLTVTRTASNARELFNNNTSSASDATASVGVPNLDLFIGQRNDDGSPNASCEFTGSIAATCIGGGLSSTEVANLYSRLRTYMTAVGVP